MASQKDNNEELGKELSGLIRRVEGGALGAAIEKSVEAVNKAAEETEG